MLSPLAADPLSARGIAAFVAAVEAGSLHGAADELGLTQSAVTKRIQALERRAGATLLERSRLGVEPTETGRMLYPEAKEALSALGRAAMVVSRANAAHAHALRIAASHTVGEFLVPGWLAAFRRAIGDPTLHSEVDVVNSPCVLAMVRAGDVEVGFVEGLDPLRGLDHLTLLRDELVVVVAAGHPWARRRTLRARELPSDHYLTRERDSGTRAVATAALASAGVELEPALVTPSIQGLKRAVLDGGFTILSRVAVEGEAAAGTLRTLTVSGVDLSRDLQAVRDGWPDRGSAAARLWGWMRDRMDATAYPGLLGG
jgi:DNA-binding transcriptional LysR family regulator